MTPFAWSHFVLSIFYSEAESSSGGTDGQRKPVVKCLSSKLTPVLLLSVV
ncbi:hypothetical protein L917_08289 [Phytophthora nicotianae]|uniref:Uncharacterized protein n=1 Tax=Phytophthora nicotianae TaxID=4792 RepID=W2GXH6_PHYNI|nr:hypothetical protein L915_08463 [Phytophthora nicotianae]ETL93578.1 hypothetical protein L917_08289 [Phytophthora nicotianae]ETM46838.1 hypothetical protein L914_08341 [Phytophthora nicotianae]